MRVKEVLRPVGSTTAHGGSPSRRDLPPSLFPPVIAVGAIRVVVAQGHEHGPVCLVSDEQRHIISPRGPRRDREWRLRRYRTSLGGRCQGNELRRSTGMWT